MPDSEPIGDAIGRAVTIPIPEFSAYSDELAESIALAHVRALADRDGNPHGCAVCQSILDAIATERHGHR
jgi:hypothetical protein